MADVIVFLCLFFDYRNSEVIFAHRNLTSKWINLSHAYETTVEFKLTLDSGIAQSKLWS